jgi:hypothetical protein
MMQSIKIFVEIMISGTNEVQSTAIYWPRFGTLYLIYKFLTSFLQILRNSVP